LSSRPFLEKEEKEVGVIVVVWKRKANNSEEHWAHIYKKVD